MKNKKTFAYILIIASIILLAINIFDLDFSNLKTGKFAGIISNICMIILGVVLIRGQKNNE